MVFEDQLQGQGVEVLNGLPSQFNFAKMTLSVPLPLTISCEKKKVRDHPFKTLAFFRGEGSKIGQICRRVVVKKLPIGGE